MSGESKEERKRKELKEPVEVSRRRDELLATVVGSMYSEAKELEARERVAEGKDTTGL